MVKQGGYKKIYKLRIMMLVKKDQHPCMLSQSCLKETKNFIFEQYKGRAQITNKDGM